MCQCSVKGFCGLTVIKLPSPPFFYISFFIFQVLALSSCDASHDPSLLANHNTPCKDTISSILASLFTCSFSIFPVLYHLALFGFKHLSLYPQPCPPFSDCYVCEYGPIDQRQSDIASMYYILGVMSHGFSSKVRCLEDKGLNNKVIWFAIVFSLLKGRQATQ